MSVNDHAADGQRCATLDHASSSATATPATTAATKVSVWTFDIRHIAHRL
jgi:hypothetical protein